MLNHSSWATRLMRAIRGYVALAVSSEQGTFTREVETGLGKDRTGNMVRFAAEGLILLRDVIKGDAKL